MSVKIRRVGEKEKQEWLSLRGQLWPRYDPDQLRDEVDRMLEHPNWGIFAAQHEGRLVGFIECSIRDKAPGCETNRIGYIEGWFVVPQFRRQGIGARLVEFGEMWARANGCTEMVSDTTSDYLSSRAAHKALGYQEVKRRFHYRKSLLQESPP